MGDYGIKIAKAGASINSTDIRDYSLHSAINTLKIFMEGKKTLSVASGQEQYMYGLPTVHNITHNLGYKPMVFGYFKHPENGHYYANPCRTYNYSSQPPTWDLISVMKHLDNNRVQFQLYDGGPAMPSSPTNVDIKYYILADPRENDWYLPAGTDTDNHVGTGDYGLKVSRPGIDVKTATPKNLVFSSSFNTFKIYRIMRFTSAGTAPHGLTYPPTFFALRKEQDYDQYGNPFFTGKWIRGDVWPFINGSSPIISVDNTNVRCWENNQDVYVILCVDPLNE